MPKIDVLLQVIGHMLVAETERVTVFVADPTMVDLARQHQECVEKRQVHLGLNIFTMVSDLYYRENFHSDVLKSLLDPKNSSEGYRFLHLFIYFLGDQYPQVTPSNYTDVLVEREKDRIDISIKDRISKRAIIIENKIKDAPDQPRQLPNYLKRIKRDGYTCDAIVYLRLNDYKEPSHFKWTQNEITEIERLLAVIVAYDETAGDLLNGWLNKCALASGDAEVAFVFRQYGSLITALGKNVMNKLIMQNFYSKMMDGDNYQTAQSLRLMLDDLVGFRRDRIIEMFQDEHAPFDKRPWKYGNSAIFETLLWREAELGFDIESEPSRYVFYFWDRFHIKQRPAVDWAKDALRQLGLLEEFTLEDDGKRRTYTKFFSFPAQEEQLYTYIRAIQDRLKVIQ